MKANIKKYPGGFSGGGHTPYRLELQAENDEELALLKEMNKVLVVWVSPHHSKDKMVWWGKT